MTNLPIPERQLRQQLTKRLTGGFLFDTMKEVMKYDEHKTTFFLTFLFLVVLCVSVVYIITIDREARIRAIELEKKQELELLKNIQIQKELNEREEAR